MPRIRIALDLDVEGDEYEIAEMLFEHRETIGHYITDVVMPEDDRAEGVKGEVMGGNSHVHNTEDGDRCSECQRYSGRSMLTSV
jgi:hypothetical protein